MKKSSSFPFLFPHHRLHLAVCKTWTHVMSLTWLHVLISIPPFKYSTTLSKLPALAALRKLALLSDCGEEQKADKKVGWISALKESNTNMSKGKAFGIYLNHVSSNSNWFRYVSSKDSAWVLMIIDHIPWCVHGEIILNHLTKRLKEHYHTSTSIRYPGKQENSNILLTIWQDIMEKNPVVICTP